MRCKINLSGSDAYGAVKLMSKRLCWGLWPSAIITAIWSVAIIRQVVVLSIEPWMQAKLIFVVLLYFYHFAYIIYNDIQKGYYGMSS